MITADPPLTASTSAVKNDPPPIATSTVLLQQKQPEINPAPKPKPNSDQAAGSASSTTRNSKLILMDVPFTSQSPFAEWSDPRQQYGCEEASSLMAVRWAKGLGAMTKAEAKK